MAAIVHLRPLYSPAGAQRLLAEVEAAVTAGADLGDRRAIIGDLTRELHRNFARLQTAMVELRALGTERDAQSARLIRVSAEACAEVLGRLGPLLEQADRVEALLLDCAGDACAPAGLG